MAAAVTPNYEAEILPGDYSPQQVLALSYMAFDKLNWKPGTVTSFSVEAFTKFSWRSWSEKVTVFANNGKLLVRSELTGSQLIDFGKNKKNVEAILSVIEELKTNLTAEELETKVKELESKFTSAAGDENNSGENPKPKRLLTNFVGIFLPVAGYSVSPLLINLNILIYILMCLDGVDLFARH